MKRIRKRRTALTLWRCFMSSFRKIVSVNYSLLSDNSSTHLELNKKTFFSISIGRSYIHSWLIKLGTMYHQFESSIDSVKYWNKERNSAKPISPIIIIIINCVQWNIDRHCINAFLIDSISILFTRDQFDWRILMQYIAILEHYHCSTMCGACMCMWMENTVWPIYSKKKYHCLALKQVSWSTCHPWQWQRCLWWRS